MAGSHPNDHQVKGFKTNPQEFQEKILRKYMKANVSRGELYEALRGVEGNILTKILFLGEKLGIGEDEFAAWLKAKQEAEKPVEPATPAATDPAPVSAVAETYAVTDPVDQEAGIGIVGGA